MAYVTRDAATQKNEQELRASLEKGSDEVKIDMLCSSIIVTCNANSQLKKLLHSY